MCFCGLSRTRGTSPPWLNRNLHAIDATPARWRDGGGLAPLGAIAAPPPRSKAQSRTPRRDRSSSTFTRNSVVCNHASSRFNSFRASEPSAKSSAPSGASRQPCVVYDVISTPSPRREPPTTPPSRRVSQKKRTPLTNREERVALSP